MTAATVHASQSSNVPHLSWLRVGAWSGSFSLHLVILALLLVPPMALEMARQAEKPIITRIIDPEVVKPEPLLPQPVRHQAAPVKHQVAQPVTPPISTEHSDMSYDAPVVDAPPAIDNKPVVVDTEPSAITYGKQTRVPYPIESLRNREQGTVTLRVLVSAAGLVQAVEIEKTSGWPRLDRAARDAVKAWTFHPATHGGVAQSAWALVPVTFNLQQL